ncbi:MAG: hypothetical protein JRF60_05765 [Deltaproteobacteria bacterium]|nr:hypothetical protein [Deltaproteobacteria bacterium]MBW2564558.1 hypothetical protein [Deltaproteobacteria bacterium]
MPGEITPAAGGVCWKIESFLDKLVNKALPWAASGEDCVVLPQLNFVIGNK